jgi:uncharacterized membrane protein YfcA
LRGGSIYILGEVTSLIALAALDTLGRARLGALLGRVALLLAVPAGVGVDSLFRTVAGAMTGLVTVDALDGRLGRLMLGSLLLAVLYYTLVRSSIPTTSRVLTLRMCPSSPQLPHRGRPQS